MMDVLACLAVIPLISAGAILLCEAGLRAGDRPGGATVTAEVGAARQADGWYRVVNASVRNPGQAGVMVGLSVRRRGVLAGFGGGMRVSVPRRTTRSRLLAGRQAVLGVAGPGETGCWPVPVPPAAGRRLELVAVLGEPGRLRVLRIAVRAPRSQAPSGQPASRQPQA